jgi:hypothetical protein
MSWSGAITLRYSSTSIGFTGIQTRTSSSFTPTANSTLYVWAYGESDNHATSFSWSLSNTGGLSFGSALYTTGDAGWAGDTNYRSHGALFSATVGGSPSSMTVTADPFAGTENAQAIGMIIFDVTDDAVEIVQAATDAEQDAGGSTETHTTGTLGSAATTGNLTIFALGAAGDDVGAASTPSGWTALSSQSDSQRHQALFYRTNFTGTSETCTDLGTSVGASVSVLFEITDGSSGTNASAGNAAATGAASSATAKVSPSGGHASATGAAGAATSKVSPSGGIAAATGAAGAATAKVSPSGGHASATGTAYDATASTGGATTNVDAEHIAVSAAAGAVAASIAPSAGHASATGAAHDATTQSATSAGQASATGATLEASAAVAPSAGHASATGAAYNATAQTGSFTNASAEHIAVTASASDASSKVSPSGGHASASGSAFDASIWISVSPAVAAATAAAATPTSLVYASAGHASATGTAHQAASSNGSESTDTMFAEYRERTHARYRERAFSDAFHDRTHGG